jgi:hypothetical protein
MRLFLSTIRDHVNQITEVFYAKKIQDGNSACYDGDPRNCNLNNFPKFRLHSNDFVT